MNFLFLKQHLAGSPLQDQHSSVTDVRAELCAALLLGLGGGKGDLGDMQHPPARTAECMWVMAKI